MNFKIKTKSLETGTPETQARNKLCFVSDVPVGRQKTLRKIVI